MRRTIPDYGLEFRVSSTSYDWPGNIRELYNAVEHASVLATTETVTLADLPPSLVEPVDDKPTDEGEMRRRIQDALTQSGGNKAKAAKILGISRMTLWKWMTGSGWRRERSNRRDDAIRSDTGLYPADGNENGLIRTYF